MAGAHTGGMEPVHHTPCEPELAIAAQLREAAVARIQAIGYEEAAELLGLAAPGVEALVWRGRWEIATAMRVSVALGMLESSAAGLFALGQAAERAQIVGLLRSCELVEEGFHPSAAADIIEAMRS